MRTLVRPPKSRQKGDPKPENRSNKVFRGGKWSEVYFYGRLKPESNGILAIFKRNFNRSATREMPFFTQNRDILIFIKTLKNCTFLRYFLKIDFLNTQQILYRYVPFMDPKNALKMTHFCAIILLFQKMLFFYLIPHCRSIFRTPTLHRTAGRFKVTLKKAHIFEPNHLTKRLFLRNRISKNPL